METAIPDITLVKVPKFLATQWRNSDNLSVIGQCKRNESGELEEFRVNCDGEIRFFKCRKTTLSNPVAVQVDPKSYNLRFIRNLSECLTIFPSLDQLYKNKLKQRHISMNVKKARSTTDETREDPAFDSSDTVISDSFTLLQIFKYYNPKTTTIAGFMAEESSRTIDDAPYNRAKAKSKKSPTMDSPELKLKIFKIFESEEAKEGLQLKRIVQLTGQPLQNVKAAVEEIATQRRRPSDYKLVYHLKDLYTQDWKPVVWTKHENYKGPNKESSLNKARRAGVEVETQKKCGQNKTTKSFLPPNAAKIENETECFHVERVSYAFRTALQKARQAKNMTQVQLARAINESETVLKEYENGNAIPNGQVVQKLNKALGVKLPPTRESKKKSVEL